MGEGNIPSNAVITTTTIQTEYPQRLVRVKSNPPKTLLTLINLHTRPIHPHPHDGIRNLQQPELLPIQQEQLAPPAETKVGQSPGDKHFAQQDGAGAPYAQSVAASGVQVACGVALEAVWDADVGHGEDAAVGEEGGLVALGDVVGVAWGGLVSFRVFYMCLCVSMCMCVCMWMKLVVEGQTVTYMVDTLVKLILPSPWIKSVSEI